MRVITLATVALSLSALVYSQPVFVGSDLYPDSAEVRRQAVLDARRDWERGEATLPVHDLSELPCLIDSATGLRYSFFGCIPSEDVVRVVGYRDEMRRLCAEQGPPSNSYLSWREALCSPIDILRRKSERATRILNGRKYKFSSGGYRSRFWVQPDSTGELTELRVEGNPAGPALLSTWDSKRTLYFQTGPEGSPVGIFYWVSVSSGNDTLLDVECVDMVRNASLTYENCRLTDARLNIARERR